MGPVNHFPVPGLISRLKMPCRRAETYFDLIIIFPEGFFIVPELRCDIGHHPDKGMFSYPEDEGVEDQVIHRMQLAFMLQCVSELPEEDQLLIFALFYQSKTEREYADELGLSQKTVNNLKNRVLEKIRRKMNIL